MSDEQSQQSPKELREYADRMKAENDELKAEREAAAADRRKLLKYEAGLADLDDERFAALGEGDKDTLRSKAEAWGWLAKPGAETEEEPDDGPTEEEKAGAAASRSLRSDGTPPGQEPSEDPRSMKPYLADREKGVPIPEAQRRQIQRLVDAAHAGDERALYDPARWRAENGF
jgi:hypothetical protein